MCEIEEVADSSKQEMSLFITIFTELHLTLSTTWQCLCLSSGLSRFEPGTIRLFQKGRDLPECYELVPPVQPTGSTKAMSCLIMSM